MIIRDALRCNSCGTEICVRTSIGYAAFQVHAFPCPNCRIGIEIVLDIDHEKIATKWRNPINATWSNDPLGDTGKTLPMVTFDAINLIPKEHDGLPAPFPFIQTLHNYSNPKKAFDDDGRRIFCHQKMWPVVQCLRVHYDKRNMAYFDSDAAQLGISVPSRSWIDRTKIFTRFTENMFADFVPKQPTQRKLAAKIIRGALNAQAVRVSEYTSELRARGILADLWRQLWSIRESYMRVFPILHPLVKYSSWKEGHYKLSDYYLSDKRFLELKSLYLDAFETLSQLSILAVGFELISRNERLVLKCGKKSVDIWEYRQVDNGQKPEYLRALHSACLFVPYMSNRLRNGIGHHSAAYDIGTDSVSYSNPKKPSQPTQHIDYTDFCYKSLLLVGAVEVASTFVGAALVTSEHN